MDTYRLSSHQGNIMEVVNATQRNNANICMAFLAVSYLTKK